VSQTSKLLGSHVVALLVCSPALIAAAAGVGFLVQVPRAKFTAATYAFASGEINML